VRADGKPNRPLTAQDLWFMPVETAAVEDDFRRSTQGGRFEPPEGDGTGAFFPVTIGTRDELTKAAAACYAARWREATARYPKAVFYLQLLGYDTDPRELWEFPEVRRYVRRWARLAGLSELETANFWIGNCEGRLASPLTDPRVGTVGLLTLCGVFGEPLRQQALQRTAKPTIVN
jgi:hypothetical protein